VNSTHDQLDVERFLSSIQEVQIALVKLDEKIKPFTDLKNEFAKVIELVNETYYISKQNIKDISILEQKIKDLSDNDKKKWGAIFTVAGAFVLQIIYFLLTYSIK
jgi:hypothetical protein